VDAGEYRLVYSTGTTTAGTGLLQYGTQRQVHLPGVIGKAVRPSGIGAAAVRLLGRRKVAAFAAAVRRRSCRGVGLARARLPRHFLEL
jgi:hypothetical protein